MEKCKTVYKVIPAGTPHYAVRVQKTTENSWDETHEPVTLMATTDKDEALRFFDSLPEFWELEEEETDLDGRKKYYAPHVTLIDYDGEETLIRE